MSKKQQNTTFKLQKWLACLLLFLVMANVLQAHTTTIKIAWGKRMVISFSNATRYSGSNEHKAIAQKNDTDVAESDTIKRQIAFGTHLDGFALNDYTQVSIYAKNKLITTLKGDELNEYVFNEPGVYQVNIFLEHKKHSGACEHPNHQTIVYLTVNPIRYEWLWNENYWYNLLNTTKEFSNTSIQMPVKIFTYKGKKQKADGVFKVYVAGVDCNLTGTATLVSNKTVVANNSTQNISFLLNGTVGKGIYAQIDFTNPFEQTTSFNILKILNQ